MIENRSCKLCGSDRIKTVIHNQAFQIINCTVCKIAFTFPTPIIPDYEKMDFHSKTEIANTEELTSIKDLPFDWQKLIEIQIEMIQNNFSEDQNILEIGCGEGILLRELQKNKFQNLHGIEPSDTAALRAQKSGLDITNEYFNDETISKKFDLIIMSHVFEHIQDIKEFIPKLKNVLNEKGGIMLTQTNFKGLIPTIQKEDWYAWVPEQHFWHFTPKGIKQLFSTFGFDCTHLKYSSLVHPHDTYYKIGKLFPKLQDQFIILLKLS